MKGAKKSGMCRPTYLFLVFLIVLSMLLFGCDQIFDADNSAETAVDSAQITEPSESELASELATAVDVNIAPRDPDMTAKELYLAIHEDEIPYDTIAEYPVFRAEVEQKFSDYLGHPIAWEDLSFAIGDITEIYHYFFWIQDSGKTVLQMCAVNAYQDTDGSIKNGLAWEPPYIILGNYTFGDDIIRIDETYFINKTQLDALLASTYILKDAPAYSHGMEVYPVQYDGIRYGAGQILVPVVSESEGILVVYTVTVDDRLDYQMLPGQGVDIMALSPYDFLVTHQTFGLKPQELMEYFPDHPLNARYVVSGHMGVDDILQSDYYMYSGFGTQPYIRVKDSQTDVTFGLSTPQTPAGEVLDIADITEDTTYQDLAWIVWM